MTRQELATWLGVTPQETGVHFTLAVLRDVFGDDHGVRSWLRAPRGELGGLCALDLLRAGRTLAVEALAVREWHRPRASALSYVTIAATPTAAMRA